MSLNPLISLLTRSCHAHPLPPRAAAQATELMAGEMAALRADAEKSASEASAALAAERTARAGAEASLTSLK